jgi:hypothetical protein
LRFSIFRSHEERAGLTIDPETFAGSSAADLRIRLRAKHPSLFPFADQCAGFALDVTALLPLARASRQIVFVIFAGARLLAQLLRREGIEEAFYEQSGLNRTVPVALSCEDIRPMESVHDARLRRRDNFIEEFDGGQSELPRSEVHCQNLPAAEFSDWITGQRCEMKARLASVCDWLPQFLQHRERACGGALQADHE